LEINNIEKPYSYTAAQIRLLFSEDSVDWDIFPDWNEHEFTGYKNKKGYEYFKSLGIPFDGSVVMYRVLRFEGEEIIHSLLRLMEPVATQSEYDPRARTSSRWFITGPKTLRKIQVLFHIMGLREMLSVSRIEIPEGVEVFE
jgi:hypothetical protein